MPYIGTSSVSRLRIEWKARRGQTLWAVAAIEDYGLKNPRQLLEALGYTNAWEGLDYEKSRIKKVVSPASIHK